MKTYGNGGAGLLEVSRDRKREDGFSLIELIVVVLVIGIIAGIAIPVFLNAQDNARQSAVEESAHAGLTTATTALLNGETAEDLRLSEVSDQNDDINVELIAGGVGSFDVDELCVQASYVDNDNVATAGIACEGESGDGGDGPDEGDLDFFGLEGSANGISFETSSSEAPLSLPEINIQPGSTEYFSFSLRTVEGSVGGDVTAFADENNTGGLADYLTYGLTQIEGTTCDAEAFQSGATLVVPGEPLFSGTDSSVGMTADDTFNYCFELHLPEYTPNDAQGMSSVSTWEFLGEGWDSENDSYFVELVSRWD